MNSRNLSMALVLFAGMSTTAASPSGIFPNPQEETVGSTAFVAAGASYRLTGASDADADAVSALNRVLPVNAGGTIDIVIGEAGDAAVSSVAANIPQHPQAYYLKVEPSKVTIAGRDGAGTYYGVQSFIQLVEQGQVPQIEVKDWPLTEVRGVVEGYYGNPWSHEDCIDMCSFFDRVKMNTFIYGPKNDSYHSGGQVFDPYPAAQAANLRALVEEANKHKVDIVWAIHPGSRTATENHSKAKAKFEAMYELGFRRFAVFFDDVFNKNATAEAAFVNYLNSEFVKKKNDVKGLIVCHEQYNQAWVDADRVYFTTIASELDADVDIMWTGAAVVDMTLGPSCDWFYSQVSRKPFIWHNYPCSDYGSRPLLMCPYEPAVTDLYSKISGFTANPMEYYEASKVGLYGMGDFAWNPEAYDAWEAWEESIEYIMPDHSDAFRTFCLSNINYPAPKSHGKPIIYTETPDFKTLLDTKPFSAANVADYSDYFAKQLDAARELRAINGNRLVDEIAEWLHYYELQSNRGSMLADMQIALDARNADEFVAAYSTYAADTKTGAELRSRDYQGSLRVLTPFCGSQFVEPFITSTVDRLVDEFKNLGLDYPEGLFPERIIENGLYHIIHDGRYLHNGKGGNPTFTTSPDNVNPNRDVWRITYDSQEGRYSIYSAEDERYVNELGNFGTNAYLASWNTYHLQPLGHFWAIQNDGNSGKKYWTVSGDRIQQSGSTSWSVDNFMFQIVPAGEDIPQAKPFAEGDYYLFNEEGKALRTLSGNVLGWADLPENPTSKDRWTLSIDTDCGRFKISQDGWFIDEEGRFQDPNHLYLCTWNTYELYARNGKMAIRNADLAGTDFWYIKPDGKISHKSDISFVNAFTFGYRSVDGSDSISEVTAPVKGDGAIYDLQGRRVTNPSNGIFIQNGRKQIYH